MQMPQRVSMGSNPRVIELHQRADGEVSRPWEIPDLTAYEDEPRIAVAPATRANGHAAHDANAHAKEEARTFALLWFATLDQAVRQPQLVSGLLLAGSLFLVFGESNSGKTFFVLDLALAIATGTHWCGRRVAQGLVIYLAGEGAGSVRNRVAAVRQTHPELPDTICFAIIPGAVNFLDSGAVDSLIATVRAAESKSGKKCVLIAVDTLARSLQGGDENNAQDMGLLIANADRVRAETGAAIGFVHHSGKDSAKGARGHSSLRAAVDTEILIEGTSDTRSATVSKQRDLEPIRAMSFELEPVQLGMNEDGSPITSCVVRHLAEAPTSTSARSPELRGKAQRQLIAAIRAQAVEHGSIPWTLAELREIARRAGLSKSTSRSAVDALANSPYFAPSVGGYLFTDGATS